MFCFPSEKVHKAEYWAIVYILPPLIVHINDDA